MIRSILFDMDGVLMDSEPVHYQLWRQVFARRGLEVELARYQRCIGSNLDSLFRMALECYGVDFRPQREAMIREFAERKREWFRENPVPQIPGAAETVRALHGRGCRLAVASSSSPEEIAFCVEQLHIRSCFDVLCSGQYVAHPKPAPDVFLLAAEMLHAAPEECLVIEDSRNGAMAAKAAGMECWGFRNPGSGCQDLSMADWEFWNFPQIWERLGRGKIG